MNFPVNTLIALAFFAGIVFLQIFLSKRESKWPGLILPIISFIVALLFPLLNYMPSKDANYVVDMIVIFLLANIPTVILLGIYLGCRGKQQRKKQLEKMNIQDLN